MLVLRTVDREPQIWYTQSNVPAEICLRPLVQVHGRRHGTEEVLDGGKGEVPSVVGRHRHPMLALLALWLVIFEGKPLVTRIPEFPVPQLREVFARLLQPELPSPQRIPAEVGRALRRNEEARICLSHSATDKLRLQ